MNTLTQFINAQLSLSHQLTAGERLGIDEASATGLYEIIENEEIKSRHFSSLAVSGSLFSLTTFTDVTFESCVFYANKFENCNFINCTFTDCKFEFTQVQHCRYNGCKLEDTTFSVSPIKKCTIAFTQYDHKFSYFLSKEENKVINCQELEPVTWEEALKDQAFIATKGTNEEATASLKIDLISAVQQAFNKLKAA
jgi:uncharacterized protein YjbI with pentapeptide repeats